MGPNETYELLYSKGNHKQKEKTIYRLGKKKEMCKQCNQQGLNL